MKKKLEHSNLLKVKMTELGFSLDPRALLHYKAVPTRAAVNTDMRNTLRTWGVGKAVLEPC